MQRTTDHEENFDAALFEVSIDEKVELSDAILAN